MSVQLEPILEGNETHPEKHSAKPQTSLLDLPTELRLDIFERFMRDTLIATHNIDHIFFQEAPKKTFARPPLLAIFLVNKVLHREAEEALWKCFPSRLVVYDHYKYPVKENAFLQLSTFAYSAIRTLSIFLDAEQNNATFRHIKSSREVQLGSKGALLPSGTWRFENVVPKLTGLKSVYFCVRIEADQHIYLSVPERRWRCVYLLCVSDHLMVIPICIGLSWQLALDDLVNTDNALGK